MHGDLTYLASQDAYNLTQVNLNTGAVSQQVIPCQDSRDYTVPIVVFEKTWPCRDYPYAFLLLVLSLLRWFPHQS